jgi:hypothetical protein
MMHLLAAASAFFFGVIAALRAAAGSSDPRTWLAVPGFQPYVERPPRPLSVKDDFASRHAPTAGTR